VIPPDSSVLAALPRSWQWWEYLKPFGLFHWVTIFAFLYLVRRLRRRGVALRGTPALAPYRRALGWTILVAQLIADLIQYRVADNIKTALPLQVCDLAAYGAAAMFLFPSRRLHAVLFFWGFGLCHQALITPSVREGFLHYGYWYYWGIHAMIFLAAGWAVTVDRFRPELRDVRFASLALLAYTLGAMVVDELLAANYGFVGRTTPRFRTLVQELGPWPERVLVMYVMAVGMFLVLWAVYRWIAARRTAASAGSTGSAGAAQRPERVGTPMREGA